MSNLNFFNNISVNKPNKTFTIHAGSNGTYEYEDVIFSTLVYEESKYKGKTEMFTHTLSRSSIYANFIYQGNVYCGLKIVLKDRRIIYVYVSEHETQFNSLQFHEDNRKAESFIKFLKKHRTIFKNVFFNTNDKMFSIQKGDIGTYCYTDIIKCKIEIEYEDYFLDINKFASYNLDDKQKRGMVVLYFRLKNGILLKANISDRMIPVNTNEFLSDRIMAEDIKNLVKRIIKKYR